ncbi:MAG: DNA-3-methyladenine glycosylase [Actinobacteria bacterium]|nr:DNA-3-methyladenine glycosylase [Actinomycetota bacterium]
MALQGRGRQRVAARQAQEVPAQGSHVTARLPRSFYARPAVEVAPELLGRVLVRILPDGTRLAARLVETEAYEPGDPASHSFVRVTPRNAVMFGAPGHLYVYFTYGNHWMMNAVTRSEGEGSAVLLRAAEPMEGAERMAELRGRGVLSELCSGPGKLAQAFGIDRAHDGEDLVRGDGVWIERGKPVDRGGFEAGIRVGVSAGLDRKWRFWVRGDPFVSRGRPGPPTRKKP